MDIAVIGSGNVGMALATGLSEKGHTVMLGSRDPSQAKLAEWVAEDPDTRRVGGEREAADFGDIVMIAVPGRSLPQLLDDTGRDPWERKLVIDATNPFARDAEGRTIDAFGDDDSGTEYLQRELPTSAVVKAFNEISPNVMLHPERASTRRLHIAGDSIDGKRRFTELAESFGWEVVDLGGLMAARALEHKVLRRFS